MQEAAKAQGEVTHPGHAAGSREPGREPGPADPTGVQAVAGAAVLYLGPAPGLLFVPVILHLLLCR